MDNEQNYPTPQIDFSNNSLTTRAGYSVTYWVSKPGYISVTGNVADFVNNVTIEVPLLPEDLGMVPETISLPSVDDGDVSGMTLEASDLSNVRTINRATLRVNPIPSDSIVDLSCGSEQQVRNFITANIGDIVNLTVSHEGYYSISSNIPLSGDQTITVNLSPIYHKVTVTGNPSTNIEIILTDTQEVIGSGTSEVIVFVPYNSSIKIRAQETGYVDYESPIYVITDNRNINLSLQPRDYLFVINCNQSGATYNYMGGAPEGDTNINYKSAPYGSVIKWVVSKQGFISQSGQFIVRDTNNSINVNLSKDHYTYTLDVTPSNATINFTLVSGTEISRTSNSITVEYESEVSWLVSAVGYESKTSDSPITVLNDTTDHVELNRLFYTLTVAPTPVNAIVELTALGYNQEGNSITVPYNTVVNCYVHQIGYISYPQSGDTGDVTVSGDTTLSIMLAPDVNSGIIIVPTPSNSTVSFETFEYSDSWLRAWLNSNYSPSVVYTLETSAGLIGQPLYNQDSTLMNAYYNNTVNSITGNSIVVEVEQGNYQQFSGYQSGDVRYGEWTPASASQEDPNMILDTVGKNVRYTVDCTGYLSSTENATITQDPQYIQVVLTER